MIWKLLAWLASRSWAKWALAAVGALGALEVYIGRERRRAVAEAEARRERDAARWGRDLADRVRQNEGRLEDEANGSGDPRRTYLDFLRKRGRVRPPGN